MVYDPNFHELEYFVALDRAPEALTAMRELMQRSLPDSIYPLEVRTVGPHEAFPSPQYQTPTVVISVSGTPGTDYRPTSAQSTHFSPAPTPASTGASSTS